LIRWFSDIKPTNPILVFVVMFLFRVNFLFKDFEIPQFTSENISSFFVVINQNKWMAFSLSTLLVYFTALALNFVVIKHEILFRSNYLSSYFYVILSSFFEEYYYIGPSTVINLIIIFSFHRIFELYKANNPIDSIFFSGLLTGITVLFSVSYFVFFPFLILGILFFRNFNLKELVAAVFGFTLPIYLSFILNYIVFSKMVPSYYNMPDFLNFNGYQPFIYSAFPFVLVFILFATFRLIANFSKNNIKTRRIFQLLYIYIVLVIILVFTGHQSPLHESILLVMPGSLILAYYYTSPHKIGKMKLSFHWLFLATVFAFQYKFLFE
jgi:hypothetical protein